MRICKETNHKTRRLVLLSFIIFVNEVTVKLFLRLRQVVTSRSPAQINRSSAEIANFLPLWQPSVAGCTRNWYESRTFRRPGIDRLIRMSQINSLVTKRPIYTVDPFRMRLDKTIAIAPSSSLWNCRSDDDPRVEKHRPASHPAAVGSTELTGFQVAHFVLSEIPCRWPACGCGCCV